MKRMVYIIIAVAAIAISGVIVAGCAVNPPTENNSRGISGLSLSQHHMDFSRYYSFYIRNDNGKIIFDADVRMNEEPYEIILEGLEVDSKAFDKMLSINEKYSINNYVLNYKKKNLPFEAKDKPQKKTTIYYTDGTDKSAATGSDYEQELYDFFKDLAIKYYNISVPTQN